MTIPDASQRVVEAGRELGFEVDIHLFPEGTKTSQDAAAAIGCELSAIAKSIVMTLDDEAQVVVFASGDTRIDPDRLAAAAGAGRGRILLGRPAGAHGDRSGWALAGTRC